jgi:predicted dehydrogenase
MTLTPERRAIGRRNFLKALAGTPALATLSASPLQGPLRGGPVRTGFIGVGSQGRALLGSVDPAFADVRAICDINPAALTRAAQVPAAAAPARRIGQYAEWRDMIAKEDLEAVIVAVPLWAHADVVVSCLQAGKHVLCEKMMAWDVAGCERMKAAAESARRVLEIGYHRAYSPVYQAAYEGIVKRGLLGDVYHARLAWHRNGNWRRTGTPPSPDYDPSKWGYPTFEHLWNWRLYTRYSRGLFAELCSHQINATNWFLGSAPASVLASGGVYRFKDGRESHDHVFGIFEYPNGLTATFSSLESNAFDQHYEAFFGTKATLVMYNESEALLFDEDGSGRATSVETTPAAPVDVSETKPAPAAGPETTVAASSGSGVNRSEALTREIAGFCSAVRTGSPLACGPQRAFDSARACIAATEAAVRHTRVTM